MNVVILTGNTGSDIELRTTSTGKSVANFSIAESGVRGDEAVWHRVVAWEKTAEKLAEYVGKGSNVTVQGRLTYNEWEDKQGNKRVTAEIVANRIQWNKTNAPEGGGANRSSDGPDDDIPF